MMGMSDNLIAQVDGFVRLYGEGGYSLAVAKVLGDRGIFAPVRPVLKYFLEECWPNMQHPSLVALACESVGGDPKAPEGVGGGLVLLTGAADIHDDIIDKSLYKGSLQTAYGKFGLDLVLLAGDFLMLKALTQLNEAIEAYPVKTRRAIRRLIEAGFFELAMATAVERGFKGTLDLDPKRYMKVICAKGAVSEACARIGGIIGQGLPAEVEALGEFGRILGILMTLRHEFKDMHNPAELRSRSKNETLPLPLFYAFQDKKAKSEILNLLKFRITQKNANEMTRLALKTKAVNDLRHEMDIMARHCEENILTKLRANREPFKLLLKLAIEDL
jgi:geranylgeranyl pyrophosphate synthase